MSTYRLKNLLAPRSLALAGASPRQGSVGRSVLRNIRDAQFKGQFGLVNTHYGEVDGIAAVQGLGGLSFVPELVVITAPATAVQALIEEAGRLGSAGAVIITAGLGHGEGSLAEAAEGAARKYGMRLIGPNCLGIMENGRNARSAAGKWGILFQQGALFSSLTVVQNIQFPLRENLKLSQELMDEIAVAKLEMVGLRPEDGEKLPAELSGGMSKRAADTKSSSCTETISKFARSRTDVWTD